MLLGDYKQAASLLRESLGLGKELRDKRIIAESLSGLAEAALIEGEQERAVCLFGAADALRETIWRTICTDQDKVGGTHERLGEAAFATAWAKGRAMTLEQAVEYALEADDTNPFPAR